MILRLYSYAEDHWPYIETSYPGVDLINMPIYRFCNYVWAWVAARIKAEQFEMWVMEMEAPLPGMEKKISENDLKAEEDSFFAVMNLQKA